MGMWTVIVKNPGGAGIEIADLGITIPAAGQETLVSTVTNESQYSFVDVAGSDNLKTLVNAGTLVINDGVSDLSIANAIAFLTLIQQHHIAENYYNKTEMNTAGGGAVIHWDNISGKPAYGQPDGWERPVKYRVLVVNASTAPASPNAEDVYVSNTAEYLKYDGAAWQSEGTAVLGDRVIDLSDGDQSILEFDGSVWVDQGPPTDAFAIVVDDDGDGKGAQYVYSSTTSDWSKIGDLDWADHFNGGTGKHDASEIDVEGIYANIPGTPTNLESTVGSINAKFGAQNTAIDEISLDKAYDQTGGGAGRTITADNGPVKIDATSSTNAALEIPPKGTRSSTGLAAGQIEIGTNGIPYVYDPIRSKWLSFTRPEIVFGREGRTGDIALNYCISKLPSTLSGFRLLRNATITGITCQLSSSGSCNIHIRANDSATNLATLTLSSETGNQRADLDVDLAAGNYLQCFCESATKVNDPVVAIEYAWRG